MTDEARQRVLELRREIAEHRRLYYQENAPEVSDAEYDALERELASLEARFPELQSAESPTTAASPRKIPRVDPT